MGKKKPNLNHARNMDIDAWRSRQVSKRVKARLASQTQDFIERHGEDTDEQLKEFRRVRELRQEERRRQNVTLRLTPQTIRIAKSLGKGYTGVLSRIIEDTLSDPASLKRYL